MMNYNLLGLARVKQYSTRVYVPSYVIALDSIILQVRFNKVIDYKEHRDGVLEIVLKWIELYWGEDPTT